MVLPCHYYAGGEKGLSDWEKGLSDYPAVAQTGRHWWAQRGAQQQHSSGEHSSKLNKAVRLAQSCRLPPSSTKFYIVLGPIGCRARARRAGGGSGESRRGSMGTRAIWPNPGRTREPLVRDAGGLLIAPPPPMSMLILMPVVHRTVHVSSAHAARLPESMTASSQRHNQSNAERPEPIHCTLTLPET